MSTSKYSLLMLMLFVLNSTFSQKVEMVYSTASQRWVKAKKFMARETPTKEFDFVVNTDSLLQEIDGIGGAFNEIGWDALGALPNATAEEVFNALFSSDGCNFSMCRIPLGASDYALSYYSSNDVPEDFEMRDFNIDRDRYILIPYLKSALEVNPELKIWASPWSPPAWMKVNDHYAMRSGGFGNALDGNKMIPEAQILNNATAFKMQERYLKAYALYFSKFVQAYKKEGVKLFSIQPQNEIAYQPNWPSCTWRPEDMGYFISEFLGPQFKTDNVDSEIWLGTVNSGDPNYVRTVLNFKDASKYIEGIGFQWGGAKAIPTIHKEYPDIKLMQTENKCGEHENDWTSLERSWNTLVHFLNNGAGSHMYWNMVLDETGKSAWGWPQNSMVVVNKTSKEVTYTDEFYLFKHLSHFVQPGDHYLKSSKGKNHIVFQLKDGRVAVLVNNPSDNQETLNFKIDNKGFAVNVKPNSINTILITK